MVGHFELDLKVEILQGISLSETAHFIMVMVLVSGTVCHISGMLRLGLIMADGQPFN